MVNVLRPEKYLIDFRLVQDHISNQDMFCFSKERKEEGREKQRKYFFWLVI